MELPVTEGYSVSTRLGNDARALSWYPEGSAPRTLRDRLTYAPEPRLPPPTREGPEPVASQVTSRARSLGNLPLTQLWARPLPPPASSVELTAVQTRQLIGSILESSDEAVERLAEHAGAHIADLPAGLDRTAAAFHRILTRSRFLKGSRSCFPMSAAREQIAPFVARNEPITVLVSGFPFKQCDNGLKAIGPLPDLAEIGALIRLRELSRTFSRLYAPGMRIRVLADGGYHRPRSSLSLAEYRRALRTFLRLVGGEGTIEFIDRNEMTEGLLGPDLWAKRARQLPELLALIEAVAGPLRPPAQVGDVDRRIERALGFPTGSPPFRDVLTSLVYSVPVPPSRGVDPVAWSQRVLSAPYDTASACAPRELRGARRIVLEAAWRDTVRHTATTAVDELYGIGERYPRHVRLATVASRSGCAGFSYLGGPALLPWHGTGSLDGRGRVCVDFGISLQDRGFVPVRSALLPTEQPLFMVPANRVSGQSGGMRLDEELVRSARLRSR